MTRKAFLRLHLKALKHFHVGDFAPSKDVHFPTYKTNWTVFHIVLKIICLVAVFGGLFGSADLSEFSLNFTEFANVLLGCIKYGILILNRNKVYGLVKMIEVDRLSYTDDDSILESGTGATRRAFLAYLSFSFVAAIGYYTASFRKRAVDVDDKWFVVAMYTPFDYYIKERYGVLQFILSLLLVYQIYCHIFIDLFSASVFIFISRQFKTVAYLFETIQFREPSKFDTSQGTAENGMSRFSRERRPPMPSDLRKAIVYHGLLLECGRDLQYVWRYIFFFQILEICVPMCLCMYLVVNTVNYTYDEIWDTSTHFNFLVYLFYQLYLMTSCADETRREALLVSEGAYFSNWAQSPVTSRKELINVIQRANKPLAFSALGVCAIDMETYISIIKTVYGAFALLRNFT